MTKPIDEYDWAENTLDFMFEIGKRSAVVGAATFAISNGMNPDIGFAAGVVGFLVLCLWCWVRSHQLRYLPSDPDRVATTWKIWVVRTFAIVTMIGAGVLVYCAAVTSL